MSSNDGPREPVVHAASVPSTTIFRNDIFANKVLFCTGGGTGICRGIVRSMMLHGCDAVIVGRRSDVLEKAAKELEKETGRKCLAAPADVRDLSKMEAAAKKAVDAFGGIDFVVCGAAGNFLSPLDGTSSNAFRSVLEIDLLGTFHTIKATANAVRARRGAYLSISATLHYAATPFQMHVGAAKAGIDALSQSVAIEWGPMGIRSNVIAPGPIEGTEGVDRLVPKAFREEVQRSTPVQRYGTVDDIANAAVFLFSPAASYITGTVLVVDGGEWHTRAGTKMIPYPDVLLMGGDFKEVMKSML